MAIPTSTQRGENLDMLAVAPAGISLTKDNANFPWGNPPREADPNKVLTKSLDALDNPTNKDNMLKLLLAGVSVESLIEGWVYAGFESGEYSLDTALLLKAPLATYMANMAEEEGVPYRLFENEKALQEDEIPDETILRVMKQNNPNMYSFINEEVNKVIRMGGPEKVEQRINDSKPQSFLLAKPSEAGEEQI
tara:strand:+ start:927 stop:1505 length:579 start_codon:yes stop_codon:yes gene_type:complete